MRHIFTLLISLVILRGLITHAEDHKSINDPFKYELSVDPSDINVGSILQGQTKNCSIKLQNIAYTGTLTISKISTSCYCVAPKLSQSTLKPRDSSEVKFELKAGNIAKKINEIIAIEYSNLSTQDIKVLKIPISGNVDSIVEISPRRLEFECMISTGKDQKKTLLARFGSSNLSWCKLTVESKPSNIINSKIFPKDGVYEIQIVPKIDCLSYGANEGWVVISCVNDSNKVVFQDYIPLFINNESPIYSEPQYFYLDDLQVGREKKLSVKVLKKHSNTRFLCNNLGEIETETYSISTMHIESKNDMELLVKITPHSSGLLKTNLVIPFESDRHGELSIPIVGIVK